MIVLGLLIASVTGKQIPPKRDPVYREEAGFTRLTFFSGPNSITVILPNEVCPNDTISATIFATDTNLKLEELHIDIGDAHDANPEGTLTRRTWKIPTTSDARLPVTAWLTKGASLGTTYIPISTARPKPAGYTIPSFVRIGAPFVLQGPFNGEASDTKMISGEQDLPVVAESPRSAVALIPSLSIPGEQPIKVVEDQFEATANSRFLLVNLAADKSTLKKGDRATLTVSVQGVDGVTADRAPMIVLENLTPKIIDIEGKVKHFIIAKPGKEGDFSQTFSLTSLLGGGFGASVTVDPGKGTFVAKP